MQLSGIRILIVCITMVCFTLIGAEPSSAPTTTTSRPSAGGLRKVPDRSNPRVQFGIGESYATGLGTEKDPEQAVSWYRKSAEQGFAPAQSNLGTMYAHGEGVDKDAQQAVLWWRKAAEQGFPEAQSHLGVAYATGEGVAKDAKQAVMWLSKAAERQAEAQRYLGMAYAKGEGIGKDAQQAAMWWRKAAELGDSEAQVCLGAAYASGEGVEKDAQQAAEWYRKAAEQRHLGAQYVLGGMYAMGEGVAKDLGQAVFWYRKAAERGYALAQCSLGAAYAAGEGVTKDGRRAVLWWRQAAEQGNERAQYSLGVMYAAGDGVERDPWQAVAWYRKAAERGYAMAQYNLATAYAAGEGVAKDDAVAYMWAGLAAEKGNEGGIKLRDLLEKRMPAGQIEAGKALIRERSAQNRVRGSAGEITEAHGSVPTSGDQLDRPALVPNGYALMKRVQLPCKIVGMAFDGQKIQVYDRGADTFLLVDPTDGTFSGKQSNGRLLRPGDQPKPWLGHVASFAIVEDRVWIGSAAGHHLYVVDPNGMQAVRVIEKTILQVPNSQSYSAMVFDGSNVWVAWHMFDYKLPNFEAQALLKMDPETGEVLSRLPVPADVGASATQSLTWDGTKLWHMKNHILSAIDARSGRVVDSYRIRCVVYPSGLAWTKDSLWIGDSDGALWQLPFVENDGKTEYPKAFPVTTVARDGVRFVYGFEGPAVGGKWFGGDSRAPTPDGVKLGPRNVGTGESFQCDRTLKEVEVSVPINSPKPIDAPMPLILALRAEDGAILEKLEEELDLKAEGTTWVKFKLKNDLKANTRYVFTWWLSNGFESGIQLGSPVGDEGQFPWGWGLSAQSRTGSDLSEWSKWGGDPSDSSIRIKGLPVD